MRQTIFAVVVLSAVGIRRWPSVDVVEDLTGELIKGGHNKLVSTIQSLLQNQDVAGWSSNSSALTAAITSLSNDVVTTLINQNSAAQTTITERTNDFQNAISHRESVEGAARAAEKTLAEAVELEKTWAEEYWKRRKQLGTDMVAAFEPCKKQEDLTNFQHTLTPETSFLCDFSLTNSDGCTQKFATFKVDVDGMVKGLNDSMISAQSDYSDAVKACSGAINTADKSMGKLIAAYDKWESKRGRVAKKHSSRRSTGCDSGCDGLSGAIAAECSARTKVMSIHARTNSDNNTDSLADRNYELQSLEVVDCLLKKLQDFGNDEFDGSNVNAIVSDCQQRKDWDDYVLDWKTSVGHAGDCNTSSTAGVDLSVLTGSTLCDDTTLSVAFSKNNNKQPVHGGYQSMYISGVIPWHFNGKSPTPEKFQVPTPEKFQEISAKGSLSSSSSVPCSDWCPQGEANCLQETLRTLTCTGNDQATNLDNIIKVQETDVSVPKDNKYNKIGERSPLRLNGNLNGLVLGCPSR